MKLNLKLILRTDKVDKRNQSPIFLRVTSYYKVQLIYTSRKVQARFWNKDKEQVRSTHPDAVEMNQYLEDFVRTARDRFRQGNFDPKAVSKASIVPDVLSFIDKLIKDDYNKPEQRRTQQKFTTVKNKLVEFAGTLIPFEGITKNFVQEFDTFLKMSHSNKLNTRIMYLKALRRTMNAAIEQGVATISWPKVKMTEERGERTRLSIDQVKMLQEYAPVDTHRHDAKQIWLFQFFAGGLRISDAVSLEWSHIQGDSLHFVMGKSKKWYSIKLISQAKELIAGYEHRRSTHTYVFPYLPDNLKRTDVLAFRRAVGSATASVNKSLKQISLDLGLPHFSTHTARHSIAQYALTCGMSIYSLKGLLRHSSVKITEGYLAGFSGDSISTEFSKIFETQNG